MLHQVAGGSLDNAYICSQAHPDIQCDPKTVNKFDRGAINNHSKTWDAVGTYGLFAIIAGGLVGTALDNGMSESDHRFRGFAADATIVIETTGIATLTTHVIRYGVRRSRPTEYVGGADVSMSPQERHLSFPSGPRNVRFSDRDIVRHDLLASVIPNLPGAGSSPAAASSSPESQVTGASVLDATSPVTSSPARSSAPASASSCRWPTAPTSRST